MKVAYVFELLNRTTTNEPFARVDEEVLADFVQVLPEYPEYPAESRLALFPYSNCSACGELSSCRKLTAGRDWEPIGVSTHPSTPCGSAMGLPSYALQLAAPAIHNAKLLGSAASSSPPLPHACTRTHSPIPPSAAPAADLLRAWTGPLGVSHACTRAQAHGHAGFRAAGCNGCWRRPRLRPRTDSGG
jgi:hypothetical protein